MELPEILLNAAGRTSVIGQGVKPDQLDLPSPCGEWSARAVLNHLITFSGYASERSARKQPPPADGSLSDRNDYTDGDWAQLLKDKLTAAATAWGEPGALEGMTYLAGTQMPAPLVAAMQLTELVLHGWDLAVATGQEPGFDDTVAAVTYQTMLQAGDQGRSFGIYGPAVAVDDAAPLLDKALALSGRDPRWAAPVAA